MFCIAFALLMAWSPLYGIPKNMFKATKHKFSIASLVQIHHIIPREFRRHPVVAQFDVEDGSNYMFMPNTLGKQVLHTRRPNHQGGHLAYNNYVKLELQNIYCEMDPSEHREAVQKLTLYLRMQICDGCTNIPWK